MRLVCRQGGQTGKAETMGLRNCMMALIFSVGASLCLGQSSAFADALDDAIAFLSEKGVKQAGQLLDRTNVEKLQYVSLPAAAAISDDDLHHFVALPNLTGLDLSQSLITDAGLETIVQIERLQNLKLFRVNISDEGIANLGALPNLGVLNLDSTPISGRALEAISGFPKLYSLTLTSTDVDAAGLAALQNLHSLNSLYLVRLKSFTPDMIAAIAPHPNLATLSLTFNPVGSSIRDLVGSKVQHLNFLNAKVNDEDGVVLGELSELVNLSANGNPIGDATMAAMAGLPKLNVLQIPGTAVTDAAGPDFARMTRLRTLWIDETSVGDAFVADLADLPLQTLSLRKTAITDESLKVLAGIQTLKNITLSDTAVTEAGVAALQAALPGARIRN